MNNELKQFLDYYIKNDTQFKKVNVFPLMCGVGKSTYLRYLIADALREKFGLIVITDRLDNLDNITASSDDKTFNDFINDNRHKIAILNSQNIKDEYKELHQKPIVLMSTQRYFNYTAEGIQNLTGSRHRIVFDEKPFILECRKINIKTLNNIDTMLNSVLNDTDNQTKKSFVIDFWKKINSELQILLKNNEAENTTISKDKIIYSDAINIDADELIKFNEYIKHFQKIIFKNNPENIKDIEAVNKLLSCGGVISSKKKVTKESDYKYDNYFTVVINNADKLTNTGANVFVLDGTADISPEYTLNCFNIVDCSEFNNQRKLNRLTLNLVKVSAGKTRLTSSDDKTVEQIIEYINQNPQSRCNAIFTYQAIENRFKAVKTKLSDDTVEDRFITEHFNNIKGTNKFRKEKNIAQVGLNVFSHSVYHLLAGEIERYNNHPNLTNIICEFDVVDSLMCKFILADLEQNIFRGCIRNENNTDNMTYTVFYDYENITTLTDRTSLLKDKVDGKKLLNMIYDRYKRLGATVNELGIPMEFQLSKIIDRKTQSKNNSQKIINWIMSKPLGYKFERKDILNDLNLSKKQFERIRSKNATIKALLDKCRIVKGQYIRK